MDPLGGSFYVENLTDQVEELARAYLERIEDIGGAAAAIPFMTDEIHRAAYAWQLEVESGDRGVVGVNVYQDEEAQAPVSLPDFKNLQQAQRRRLHEVRSRRDSDLVERTLDDVVAAATSGANLLPAMVEAVKVRATLGEISGRLVGLWGPYRAS